MHEPSENLRAFIDQTDFDRLRQTNPVYEDDPHTVIVSPTIFRNTPKLPYIAPPSTEQQQEGKARATAISQLRHRDKARKRMP